MSELTDWLEQKAAAEKLSREKYGLANCPFTHTVDRGVSVEVEDEEWDVARVICGDCGCMGPFVDLSDFPTHEAAEAEAARLWNARRSA